jgi:positive regulator of sigma E activity
MLGFVTFVTIMLGFVVLRAFSRMLHNFNSTDEILLASVGYDNN